MKYIILLLLTIQIGYSANKYEISIDECLVRTAHKIALTQVGVTEATGKNDGTQVEAYLRLVGLGKGYPYCAAGLSWCYYQSALELDSNKSMIPFPLTAGSQKIYDYAVSKGTKVALEPSKYDFFTWRQKDSYLGHIGMIDSVKEKGWVRTIEFNTSPGVGNQRDGDGVWIRDRNLIHPLGRLYFRGLIGFKYTSDVCSKPINITDAGFLTKPIEVYKQKTDYQDLSFFEWLFMKLSDRV